VVVFFVCFVIFIFFIRVVKHVLPREVVDAPSLEMLKVKLI